MATVDMRRMVLVVIAVGSLSPSSNSRAQTAHEDCRTVTRLSRFARIYGTFDLPVIERKRDEVCSAGPVSGSLRWPNKKQMKSAGGTWSYPNGKQARSIGGTWTYPNKEQAKSSSGTWSYPDGNVARSISGGWTLPHRDSASLNELREWARNRVPPADYTRLSEEIGAGNSDDEVIAALELAWLAR